MTEAIEYKAKLGKKIISMSKKIGAVKADARNDHSKYNYISSDNMLSLLREHLDVFNISIVPEIIKYCEEKTVTKNKSGFETTWIRTIVDMEFEIIDTETGYSIIKKWTGADQDTGGKSFGQAITESTKRFYFKLFQVSSKDDVDADSKTTGTVEPNSHIPWANDAILSQDDTNPKCIYKTWAKVIKGNVITLNDGKQYQVNEAWVKFFNDQLK